jgi:hypothetical protein
MKTVKRTSKGKVMRRPAASPGLKKKNVTLVARKGPVAVVARDAVAFAAKKTIPLPSGYGNRGKLVVPERYVGSPVPSGKFIEGIKSSKEHIKQAIQEFASIMTEGYGIHEIALSVSFDAQGKFLGFGVGGSASVKVKIRPVAPDS